MKLFIKHKFEQDRIWDEISNFNDNLLNIIDEDKGFNLLHAAAYYGHDELFLKIIARTHGEGLIATDNKGRTPIHHIASNGRNTLLRTLLNDYRESFDIEQINAKGRTPLHIAAKHLQIETVQLLIEYGANVNCCDNYGHTPLALSYHRHYPGEGITFHNPVYEYLLEHTTYWRLQTSQYDNVNFPQDQDILMAWSLGFKSIHNENYLPGIQIPIKDKNYNVCNVYHSKLSKFIVLEDNTDKILLCMDESHPSAKDILLNQHINPTYINYLKEILLQNIMIEHPEFTQVWGMELAGIDAQLLASLINFNSEKPQKLILINSPGLPENIKINAKEPNKRLYVYSQGDTLHLKGKYAWAQGAKFYTYGMQENTLDTSKLTPHKQKLLELKRRKLSLSIEGICAIQEISATLGKKYEAEENHIIETHPETTEELFDIHSQYLQNADPKFIDYARFEYCAHGLAYLHLENDNLVKWWDIEALHQKQIIAQNVPLKRVIHDKGLYCYLLQHNQELVIMFQGTDIGDSSTLARDCDRKGAGIKHIRYKYLEIINSISDALERNTNSEIKLFICGHSLGGADAQNLFTALLSYLSTTKAENPVNNKHWMKFYARSKPEFNLNKIKEVHLYAYNAAGVRHSNAALAKAAVSKLQDIIISINHQRVGQDFINGIGETILNEFDYKQVPLRNLFFNGRKNHIERTLHSHFDRQFVSEDIKEHTLYKNHNAQTSLQQIRYEAHNTEDYNLTKNLIGTRNFS